MTISVEQTHNLLKLMKVCSLNLVNRYHHENSWWLNYSDRNDDDTEVTFLSITYQEKDGIRKHLYEVDYWRCTQKPEQGESERELEYRETASGDSIDFITRFFKRNRLFKEEVTQKEV